MKKANSLHICFLSRLFVSLSLMMLSSQSLHAGFFEVSLSGTFSRTQFNELDYSKHTGGNLGVAYRFWGSSAIELGFSLGRSETFRATDLDLGAGLIVDEQEEQVDSKTYSVSWKQYLAPPRSTFLPFLRAGYANYETEGELTLRFDDGTELTQISEPQTEASGIAGVGLQIALGQMMSLQMEGSSVFPDFEIEQWEDRLRYSVGLSWIF
jgi:hypothetical protein